MTQENENATAENEAVTHGPGWRLREAREARKLSVQQAATQLRMQDRTIEALERDDYSELPGPTFVQGYLRSYSRLLGLPEESILGLAHSDTVSEPQLISSISEGKIEASSSDLPFRMVTALILVAVVVGVGWWFAQQTPSSEPSQSEEFHGGGEQGLWLPEESDSLQGSAEPEAPVTDETQVDTSDDTPALNENPAQEATASEEAVEEPQIESAPEVVSPVSEPLAVTPDDPPELTGAVPQSTLELEYQADSWSEIYDAAGRKLAYGTISAGNRLTLYGEAPFKVFLGYSSGVTIYYNGDLYDHSPFQRGDVARFRIGRAEHNQPLSGN